MSDYSKDYSVDELMTVLMAREVRNDDVMIVGVATPMVWAAFTSAKVTMKRHFIIVRRALKYVKRLVIEGEWVLL